MKLITDGFDENDVIHTINYNNQVMQNTVCYVSGLIDYRRGEYPQVDSEGSIVNEREM